MQLPLILASASPRRRELLESAGLSFEVQIPDIEESARPGESPTDYVLRNAREKAEAITAAPGTLVLAADTIVVHGGRILEKPRDPADATRMIAAMSGNTHEVMTGVALRCGADWRRLQVVCTEVVFRSLSPAEIRRYVDTGDPMDKAGAYGIQGGAAGFVSAIHGSYTNVVGLPLAEVLAEILESPQA